MHPTPPVVQHRTCYKCDFEVVTAERKCPQCGSGRVWTKPETRIVGLVLAMLGGFLMGIMAALTWWTMNMVANTGKPGATSRFTGSKEQLMMIYAIFAVVFFFGLIAFSAGTWQVVFAKRNKFLIWMVIGFGIFLFAGATIFNTFTGN